MNDEKKTDLPEQEAQTAAEEPVAEEETGKEPEAEAAAREEKAEDTAAKEGAEKGADGKGGKEGIPRAHRIHRRLRFYGGNKGKTRFVAPQGAVLPQRDDHGRAGAFPQQSGGFGGDVRTRRRGGLHLIGLDDNVFVKGDPVPAVRDHGTGPADPAKRLPHGGRDHAVFQLVADGNDVRFFRGGRKRGGGGSIRGQCS